MYSPSSHGGGEQVVFWSQNAPVELVTVLLPSPLSLSFLSGKRRIKKRSHPMWFLLRTNEIRSTCAECSNSLTATKQCDYGEQLLPHDAKTLSYALTEVSKTWNIHLKWFSGKMDAQEDFMEFMTDCPGRI